MNHPLSVTRVALMAVALLTVVACSDREPPQIDDEQQRQEIEAEYQSVHDSAQRQRSGADERMQEAHQRVDDTGEIGFPEVELDDLLNDNDENDQ